MKGCAVFHTLLHMILLIRDSTSSGATCKLDTWMVLVLSADQSFGCMVSNNSDKVDSRLAILYCS